MRCFFLVNFKKQFVLEPLYGKFASFFSNAVIDIIYVVLRSYIIN